MLRRDGSPAPGWPDRRPEFPTPDAPYGLGERPIGVLFYRLKESFYLPYQQLTGMHWTAERLTLSFASEDVILEGWGLHELYVQLAEQRVARICEQGERYAADSEAAVYLRKIHRLPRGQPSAESGG